MKVLVTGDRNYIDYEMVKRELNKLATCTGLLLKGSEITVIHGAARGADSLAKLVGVQLGYQVIDFPADWEKYGRAAGVLRNQQMLNEKPDLVLAFHKDIKESKGTKDMIKRALAAGVPVMLEGEPITKLIG